MGQWSYTCSWSDGTPGGSGTFNCVSKGAGKGVLQAYKDNPRWLAYNGTDPVFLKSYYESGHASVVQPLNWISKNVYQVLIDNGYNHFLVCWMLPLFGKSGRYLDGPGMEISDLVLYKEGKASSTQRLDIWHTMEEDIDWLNDRNVALQMFIGFDGGRNAGPAWKKLSNSEQDFYVKYVVSRLAPYANIAGWNYVWETNGNDASGELELARLIKKYDVFKHLSSYEDEKPGNNEYHRPEYNYAAIENHGYSSRKEWGKAWTHHKASLDGYVSGKPVVMTEGNALWRKFWHIRLKKNMALQ